uniref:Uncharacterized protein n=1 Tax=Arundo donax TaxID=35708 RepID=A0A0A9B6F1_ARUDO
MGATSRPDAAAAGEPWRMWSCCCSSS